MQNVRCESTMRYKKSDVSKKKFNYVNVESLLSTYNDDGIIWRMEQVEKYGDESAKLLLRDSFSTVPTTL